MRKNFLLFLMVFVCSEVFPQICDDPVTADASIVIRDAEPGVSNKNAVFSVSATRKIYFAKGNLQYQASTGTWRFAENQYDRIGAANSNISGTYSGWIDLFYWASSGYKLSPTYNNVSSIYGGESSQSDMLGLYDWGGYNNIQTDDRIIPAGTWRTITYVEWSYLLYNRPLCFALCGPATVCGVEGMIILPDKDVWHDPAEAPIFNSSLTASGNVYTKQQWQLMENAGAVFLPVLGYRNGSAYHAEGGMYWTSTHMGNPNAYIIKFNNPTFGDLDRKTGIGVRLVKNVQ